MSLADVWTGWKRFAHAVGDVQARIVLTILYFLVVGVFAVPYLLLADPLNRRPRGPSFWIARPDQASTLLEARRQ